MEKEKMSERQVSIRWSAQRDMDSANEDDRVRGFGDMLDLFYEAHGRLRAVVRLSLLRHMTRTDAGATFSYIEGTYRLSADRRCAERIGAPHPWVLDEGVVVM